MTFILESYAIFFLLTIYIDIRINWYYHAKEFMVIISYDDCFMEKLHIYTHLKFEYIVVSNEFNMFQI